MGASDRVEAGADKLKGKAKEAMGKMMNDDEMIAKGKADQVKGDLKNAKEDVKDHIKNVADDVKDN